MACANLRICWAWWYFQILSIYIFAQLITDIKNLSHYYSSKNMSIRCWNLRTDKEWKKVSKLKMSCRCCYLLIKYEKRSTKVHFVEFYHPWRHVNIIVCWSKSLRTIYIHNSLSLRYDHSDDTVLPKMEQRKRIALIMYAQTQIICVRGILRQKQSMPNIVPANNNHFENVSAGAMTWRANNDCISV